MAWNRAHSIIGDTSRKSPTDPGRVGEQRVETAVASIVEVDINTSKVVQDKVTDGVGALDGVRVAVEGLEEPWVSDASQFSCMFDERKRIG